MQIICKKCQKSIPAENISVSNLIAKCSGCNAVFDFRSQMQQEERSSIPRLETPMPSQFSLEKSRYILKITYRFRSPRVYGLAGFMIFWNAFLVVWVSIALSLKAYPMIAFAALHILVGCYLLYGTLVGLFNSMVITVNPGQLQIQHGPIPYPGNITVSSKDIAQLYCKEKITYRRRGTSAHCEVYLITKNSKLICLTKNLEDVEQALFIEQEIERHLNIEDQSVPGEVK